MSREVIEKIKAVEKDAEELVSAASEEGDRMIKQCREQIAEEKKELSQKLKRERNERILRCELKGQKTREDAEKEINAAMQELKEKYERMSEIARELALEVLLGR